MDKYGELINCDNLHFAEVTKDDDAAYTADTPEYLAPLADLAIDTPSNTNARYYDGQKRFVTVIEGDTNVTVVVSGVPLAIASKLTGKEYDSSTGLFYDTGDVSSAPWFALSARTELGDGGYRYLQMLKGKFSISGEKAHTREDNITVNTTEITYSAVKTVHKFTLPSGKKDGLKGVKAESTDEKFTGGDTWFNKVQAPSDATGRADTNTSKKATV